MYTRRPEYGLPAQTLINWLNNHRAGKLSPAVQLSVEEMEWIRDCCRMSLGKGLLPDEVLATKKMITGIDKKTTKTLSQVKNSGRLLT